MREERNSMEGVETSVPGPDTEPEPEPEPDTAGVAPVSCCTVVWFRRDLRIEDNPALFAALRSGSVIPVFVWSPEEEGQFIPGRVSRWWLKQSLTRLDESLRAMGNRLVLRRSSNTFSALLEIVRVTGATQLFYNHLYDPISLVRDHKVKQGMSAYGITVQTFNADLLYEPWEVYDENGLAFTTFADFWDKCVNMAFEPDDPLPRPTQVPMPEAASSLFSLTAEELGLEDEQEKSSNVPLARAWLPGWFNADKALEAFLAAPVVIYASSQAKAGNSGTSLLSPHMHFGEISVRKVYKEVKNLQKTSRTHGAGQWEGDGQEQVQSTQLFLRSLGLREYSRYLSFNFPFTHERSLLSNLRSFPWRVDESCFKAWRQGRTGYPLIDAGMRELWATGWLHNRVRVTVASFCVKFLRLPWRWGMKYFWDTLLDADLECDVLGWQYISGSLPDGHELDRMEDPQQAGLRFDPDGEYVRRWLPELARMPGEWIHCPWEAPPIVLQAAGVELGCNYPWPLVRLQDARERLQEALLCMWEREAALKAARANAGGEGQGESRAPRPVPPLLWPGAASGSGNVASGVEGSGPRCRDQMVPSLASAMPAPSESAVQAAESILQVVGRGDKPGGRLVLDSEEDIAGVQPPYPEDAEGAMLHLHAGLGQGLEGITPEESSGPAALFQPFGQTLYLRGGPRYREDGDGESTAESYAPKPKAATPFMPLRSSGSGPASGHPEVSSSVDLPAFFTPQSFAGQPSSRGRAIGSGSTAAVPVWPHSAMAGPLPQGGDAEALDTEDQMRTAQRQGQRAAGGFSEVSHISEPLAVVPCILGPPDLLVQTAEPGVGAGGASGDEDIAPIRATVDAGEAARGIAEAEAGARASFGAEARPRFGPRSGFKEGWEGADQAHSQALWKDEGRRNPDLASSSGAGDNTCGKGGLAMGLGRVGGVPVSTVGRNSSPAIAESSDSGGGRDGGGRRPREGSGIVIGEEGKGLNDVLKRARRKQVQPNEGDFQISQVRK